MSDFIANNLHKKVDHIMDVFYGAGVASHPTIIEQINYLLFMRALSQHDDELRNLGVTSENEIVFDGDLEKYRWDNLLTLNAEALFNALEECFRKIPESTTNKTVRLVFRNAHIKLFDKPSLRTVLHQIEEFGKAMDQSEHEGKRDVFGDTYEYLLSKLAQAGTSGQFRTPRHIIEFIVNVVKPTKGETILDPAVGTAGFLVKAFEYLRREYTSPETFTTGGSFDKLTNTELRLLLGSTFTGVDSDEDMIKFGMMNLYLHGLKDAKLIRQNTLADTAGSRDKYDVVLANPPFSGKIDRDSVAEELQMGTGATEILFLRYMLRHLTDNGRMGVIVPEGALHNDTSASKSIRRQLIDSGVWCVMELPHGMFKPYASVKTHVVFADKSKKAKNVLFVVIKNDGFTQTGTRHPIEANDLPAALRVIREYEATGEVRDREGLAVDIVPYTRILDDPQCSLVGRRYMVQELAQKSRWEAATLDKNLIEVRKGKTAAQAAKPGQYPFVVTAQNMKSADHYDFDGEAVCVPLVSGTGHGHASVKRIHYFSGKFALANIMCAIIVKDKKRLLPKYLYHILDAKKEDALAALMTGTTNTSMSTDDVYTLRIPLPPLKEQQRFLDSLKVFEEDNVAMQKKIKQNGEHIGALSSSAW